MHFKTGNWGQLPDEKLWKAFREGRQKALSELFIRYYTRLYSYGIKILSDEEIVKDGIQHLFLKLWKKRGSIETAESVDFYLLKSLRRILLRQKDQTGCVHQRNRQYMQEEFSHSYLTVEDKIILSEQKTEREELFQHAFEMLTPQQKEVLSLRLQYGLGNEEIAEVMNLSHQRIRNLICEATISLKDQISQL